jgi:hypothetical protein
MMAEIDLNALASQPVACARELEAIAGEPSRAGLGPGHPDEQAEDRRLDPFELGAPGTERRRPRPEPELALPAPQLLP